MLPKLYSRHWNPSLTRLLGNELRVYYVANTWEIEFLFLTLATTIGRIVLTNDGNGNGAFLTERYTYVFFYNTI